MVTLSKRQYDLIVPTFSASTRNSLLQRSKTSDDQIAFDDEIAIDAYGELMDYITLHETERDYGLTPRGRALDVIATSIFKQSGGA